MSNGELDVILMSDLPAADGAYPVARATFDPADPLDFTPSPLAVSTSPAGHGSSSHSRTGRA